MRVGVDYYPEQWDSSMWQQDAVRMTQTGVKLVRLAEFAWSRLEPEEGMLRFEWLDQVVDIFNRCGIEVILSTPTNCPPLWMYQEHPEIIQVGPDGKRLQTGIRGHRCINSPVFVTYAKRITREMARRYTNIRGVVAWQIDNELEAYSCSCEVCKGKFREWLLDRFDNIANINAAFGNTVWSGEYSDPSQIEPPTAYPKAWQNPALCLEWYRFISESVAEFVKELVITIRREQPNSLITTNTWICRNSPDIYRLYRDLDFVSFDNYPPITLPENKEEHYSHAFYLDLMRGVKEQNFWVMEQLSGPTGTWTPMSPAPKPGQIMGYALQAYAHGADAVLHFRWRTALKGAEMHWHGILDHSGVPNRRFTEFSELCKVSSKLNGLLNTQIISDIAIIYSSENDYAFRVQPQSPGFSYIEQLRSFHEAFGRFGANIDVISGANDISGYKLIVAPAMYVYNKRISENLYRYVINGGTLVLTCRSGVKDNNNNCVMEVLPAVFKELVGAEVTEYDPVGETQHSIRDFAGNEFTCRTWCDIVQPTTARTYAEYNDSWYRCMPAVTMNRYCNGVAYYVGTICDADFYESFAANLMMQTGIPRLKGLPRGVEVTTRSNGNDEYIFFFNNSESHVTIPLPKPMYSVVDSIGKAKLELKPFEMDVVRK